MNQAIPNQAGEPETRVSRSFDISVPKPNNLDEEYETIGELPGVLEVTVTSDRTRLRVSYDVRATTAGDIQKVLDATNLAAPASFWRRMRITWLNTLDVNRRDNAAHRPTCCSKPPPGAGVGRHHQR